MEYSEDFKFYITTKLKNPHYLPEISSKLAIINCAVTQKGLDDQLLGLAVLTERPDLENERNTLILQAAENAKQLEDVENQILNLLSSSSGNILEDESAVNALGASKKIANEVARKQLASKETEQRIEKTRKEYVPVAEHACMLFFTVGQLSQVDQMYQYSLQWFVSLFEQSMMNAPQSSDVNTRINAITDHFTYSLYLNVGRSLFEKHKTLFSMLLCLNIKRKSIS